jgi:tetratricopeptide (TPR) repeat protein
MDELIASLLACRAAAERRAVLAGWPVPPACLALAQALKARGDALLRTDPTTARRLADLAQELAAGSADPLCAATAAWAAGNARFYAGHYAECLDLYRQAIPAFEQAGLRQEAGRLHANCVAVLTDLARYAEAAAEADLARPLLAAGGPTRFLASLEMNAAVLHRHLDDYGAALAACDRGRQIALALDNPVLVARFDVNRALILENLDSYRGAIAALAETLPIFEQHGETLELARARLNLGLLHTRAGHYRQALAELERSRQGFAALGNELEVAVTDWHRAGVYLKLNLLPEAIEHNAAARAVFAHHGLARQAALADSEAAQAYHRLGESEEATRLLGQARASLTQASPSTTLRPSPLPVLLAQLDLLAASFHLADGAAPLALVCAERGLAGLADGPFPIKRALARLALADCHLALGARAAAETAYRAALEVVGPAGLADLTYRAQFGLGQIAEAEGDTVAALGWYGQAMAVATRASLGLGGSEFRSAFVADKLAAHQAAAQLHLAAGDLAAAFAVTEQARSSVSRLLALAADFAEYDAGGPDGAELAQQREAWNWLYSRLERSGWDAPGDPAVAARGGDEAVTLAGLAAAERRLADLLRSTSRPGSAAAPPPAELAAVQARLADDEALLVYFIAREQVMGFRIERERTAALSTLVPAAEARDRLDRLRFALRRQSDEAMEELQWFYGALVAALESTPPGSLRERGGSVTPPSLPCQGREGGRGDERGRLYIVPHDLLYHLPFHALHDGERYLLERCEVVYLPAASLLSQRNLRASETLGVIRRALIVGHDHGGRLPAAPQEAQAIHDLLAAAAAQTGLAPDLLLGDAATRSAVAAAAPGAGLLHLATHGVFRHDNPLFSALRLADGWLTLADVERMDLRGTGLVTLSACETGAGDLRGGDLFGLSQAFLAAGAASLVASLWPVPDEATRRLMIGFYRQLVNGQSKAAALRAAQLALMAEPTYRHPLYWAGFGVMGGAPTPTLPRTLHGGGSSSLPPSQRGKGRG